MKKLALLSLAVSQGQTIHGTHKKSSSKRNEYYKEMNKLSKHYTNTSENRRAIEIIKNIHHKYKSRRSKKHKTSRNSRR